jgi:RNA-directed DNA polymerase
VNQIYAQSKETLTPNEPDLIERLVERKNMELAYKRVLSNKGAAGIDGMTVKDLKSHLQTHWVSIKESLKQGVYQPQPVRRVEIPKPNGGVRLLGIPTVLDRLIQQALYQILNPIFDPTFSENSYGFRSGKSAGQAISKAKSYQLDGKRWVVDMDLSKFFDEVNHDKLMMLLRRRISDKRILALIRRYLQAGVMKEGTFTASEKGTPQGGNLSPLLSNIMLDELDKELIKRGHSFCRYADDCNIYVRSRRAAERVMTSITKYVENKLKLKVNKDKSAVGRPWERKFLGCSFTINFKTKIRPAKESIEKLKKNVKTVFRKSRGNNIGQFIRKTLNPIIRGWANYFKISEVKRFAEELDGWIRRKLRCTLWRQWKRPWTRKKRLMEQGLAEEQSVMSAFNKRGAWWNAGAKHMSFAFPKKFFDTHGLASMVDIICLNK